MNVAVRELKDHLSEYLKRVSAGEEVVVTSHGKPVARLAPLRDPADEASELARIRSLPWVRAGKGGRLEPVANPMPSTPGEPSLSDWVLEDRG